MQASACVSNQAKKQVTKENERKKGRNAIAEDKILELTKVREKIKKKKDKNE